MPLDWSVGLTKCGAESGFARNHADYDKDIPHENSQTVLKFLHQGLAEFGIEAFAPTTDSPSDNVAFKGPKETIVDQLF